MGDTTIKVKDTTVERLKANGKMGDSYDMVINRLLDEHEKAGKCGLKPSV